MILYYPPAFNRNPKPMKNQISITLESGRKVIVPHPFKGTTHGLKKLDLWLLQTALNDAYMTNNQWMQTILSAINPRCGFSQSDRDTLCLYLFGDVEGIYLATGLRVHPLSELV